MVMKEGAVINNQYNRNEKRDTISWIDDAIEMLIKHKNMVVLDEARVLDGEAYIKSSAPSLDEYPTKSVSISFNYIGIDEASRKEKV